MTAVVEPLINPTIKPCAMSRYAGERIHFIGIGGCGMSGLARMLLDSGAIITGSEPTPNSVTLDLQKRGVKISRDQLGQLLDSRIDLVVRTAAVADDNPEYLAAQRYGLKVVKYAQLLGQVMRQRHGVAVAGTHGKSTTTAMIAYALTECGADPSWVVGGIVNQLGGSSHSGGGPAFVVEACEYDRSFHNLFPTVAAITNVDADHLDCYGTLENIIESFHHFLSLVPPTGLILANGDDANLRRAMEGIDAPRQWVGLVPSEGLYTRLDSTERGCCRGEVFFNHQSVAHLGLSVPGRHNLFNATLALAACLACGVAAEPAAEALGRFCGVERRMSRLGDYNGAVIIDDYGHHPQEILVTLRALRQAWQPKRLICVFQPHQHSRTRLLLDQFATCFVDADEVIFPDIYAVRDSAQERARIGIDDVVKRVAANGQNARHIAEFSRIVDYLKQTVRPGDLVVTVGAGNVCQIGKDLAGEQCLASQAV